MTAQMHKDIQSKNNSVKTLQVPNSLLHNEVGKKLNKNKCLQYFIVTYINLETSIFNWNAHSS